MRPLAPGTMLSGRFRVVRMLGFGGMGAVYEAEHVGLGRRVAVKVLHASDERQLERFRREAKAAASIGHPNIVAVLDFDAGPPAVLAMELLAGSSLGAIVDGGGAQPVARVAALMCDVLDALAAAHRAGVVHRDVKPDNVIVVPNASGETAKVLDFGIAALDGGPRLTVGGEVVGSPAYMAPEQAAGRAVDGRADVYGVGACMVHALTGRLPGHAESGAGTSSGPPSRTFITPLSASRPDLPAAFTSIVDRALSVDPALRFATVDEMRAALLPWARPPAVAVSSPPPGFSSPPAGLSSPPLAGLASAPHPMALAPTEWAARPPAPARPSRAPLVAGLVGASLLFALVVAGGVVLWLTRGGGGEAPSVRPSASAAAPTAAPATASAVAASTAPAASPPSRPALRSDAGAPPRDAGAPADAGAPLAPADAGAPPRVIRAIVVNQAPAYGGKPEIDAMTAALSASVLARLQECAGDLPKGQPRLTIQYRVDPHDGRIKGLQDTYPDHFVESSAGRCLDARIRPHKFGPAKRPSYDDVTVSVTMLRP